MGPERLVRLPPYNFISSHLSARIQSPEELTIVSQLAGVDRHVLRGTWGLGERPNDCSVDFGNSADEVEIAELGQILLNLVNVVPAGMVVFLPSYSFLNAVTAEWKKSDLITKLDAKKKVSTVALTSIKPR